MSYPTMLRTLFNRIDELKFVGHVEVALYGRGANGVQLTVPTANTLAFAGTPSYIIGGPPDSGASPVQLGFVKGDLVRLEGAGPNDGKLVTLLDPSTGTILDTLTADSPTPYYFKLIKRRTFVFTNRGREWLGRLLSWKLASNPPTADDTFYDARLRFMGLGKGGQQEIREVWALQDPLYVSGLDFLAELDVSRNVFPNTVSVRLGKRFGEGEVSGGAQDPTLISEFALYEGVSPEPISGSAASAKGLTPGVTLMEGLSGILPLHEGLLLEITGGSAPGVYRVSRYLSETSVEIDLTYPVGPETGLQWTVGQVVTDNNAPCVAYMATEGIVKSSSFALEVDWELKL